MITTIVRSGIGHQQDLPGNWRESRLHSPTPTGVLSAIAWFQRPANLIALAAGAEHNNDMKRSIPLLTLLIALAARAGERSYRSGILKQIEIKDATGDISIPTAAGQNLSIPLSLVVNYQFQIQSDMIVFVGNCWSKDKRTYGSEWVVNDPIGFRVENDKLFLKRPTKGELRLALMTRLRALPKKDEAGEVPNSFEPLPPFATR